MASIITATTTSGLTQSADNSGVLQLASGTGNLVTIPSVTGTAMVSGNMPAFSAYSNTSQSLSTGTETKITLAVEVFDTNNNFASSRFTPTVAGYYQINWNVVGNWSSSFTGYYTILYKNGSAYQYSSQVFTALTAGTFGVSTGSTLVYMNGTTDYVELYASFSGTGTFTLGTASSQTNMTGSLVRGA